ncbi:DNA-packaging protein FI [Phytobacter palmae]|uniref:DNA-packaging protein FI n=1 Tax=Phytobacter palmae TaxID=1855371 RepID=A0ABU9VB58_9ENTR
MSKKDELIARLKALGIELGREVNMSGSNEELTLRIAELEEELNDDEPPGPDTVVAGTVSAVSSNTTSGVKEEPPAELVTVNVLATLHINALHETSGERVAIAGPGTKIRVAPDIAGSLVLNGLASIN